MSGKSSNGTNQLHCHLLRCNSFHSKSKQTLLTLLDTNSSVSNWVFLQDASRDLLCKMIIAHELPFSIVKHLLFKAFIASLQPKFRVISRGIIKTDVMQIFQLMKAKIMTEIKSTDRVALTTDLWTSSTQAPFMVVSAHFILPDWSLNKRLISFKELPTPHTGLAISDHLISFQLSNGNSWIS
jgi:hypothetical protein